VCKAHLGIVDAIEGVAIADFEKLEGLCRLQHVLVLVTARKKLIEDVVIALLFGRRRDPGLFEQVLEKENKPPSGEGG
jgi:hypothetical protein